MVTNSVGPGLKSQNEIVAFVTRRVLSWHFRLLFLNEPVREISRSLIRAFASRLSIL